MSELTCSGCQATFDWERERTSFSESCPFCGADLCELTAGLPPMSSRETSRSRDRDISPIELPAKSNIVVLHREPGQLLFQIPPGKSGAANFLLFFAIFWNGIVMVVALGFLLAGQQNQEPGLWALVPFFGIFFLVGLIVLVIGISLKFTRTMLLLEPNRAVMQKTLFRYQSLQEILLTPGAHAMLVESYRQNDRPVYALSIVSGSTSLKFGTSLTDGEKDAMLKIINRHFGYDEPESAADAVSGLVHESVAAQELSPDDLSPGTLVDVIENRPDELVISFPLFPSSTFTVFVRLVLAVMGLFATGMVVFMAVAMGKAGAFQDGTILFLLPFGLMFFVPFVFVLLVLRLHVTIGINAEHVVHQIASGPFRWNRTWSAATVTGVTIRSHVVKPGATQRWKRRGNSTKKLWSYCTLDIAEQSHWLAFGPERPFCHEVAGLVRYQLQRVGHRLLDEPDSDSSRRFESVNDED